jgi:hypothetical protein
MENYIKYLANIHYDYNVEHRLSGPVLNGQLVKS